MRNGEGNQTYQNGDRYQGEFKNNLRHGEGIIEYRSMNNSHYNGEWSKDIQNGFGKYKMDNGDVYKGDILDNKMHGKG